MRSLEKTLFVKRTFKIKHELVLEIERLIPRNKRTEFINTAIENELRRVKDEKMSRKKALQEIKKWSKLIKKSLPKSSMTVQEALDEVRKESLE